MKKLIALFLAVVMLLGVMPTVSFAAEAIVVDGYSYVAFEGSEGTHTNRGYGYMFGNGKAAIYEIEFPESGQYRLVDMTLGYASNDEGPKGDLFIDGKLVGSFEYGKLSAKSDTIQTLDIGTTFEAPAGKHMFKISWTSTNPIIGVRQFTIKFLGNNANTDFSKTEGAYKNVYTPAVIEAEDFDLGAAGSFGVDGKNDGKKYREDAPIDIYQTDDKTGYYIELQQNDIVKYTFTSHQSDAYTFRIASRSAGAVKVYFDDNPNYVTAKLKGGSEFSAVDVINIYLPKGTHSVKLVSETKQKIDYIQFITATEGKYVTINQLAAYVEAQANKVDEPNPVYKELFVSPDGDDNNAGTKDAPFKSIERARDEIAKINDNMQGDIVVNFLHGYHKIDEAIEFTNDHEGKNGFNVIFRGIGDEKPIIGGGTKITGWEQTETPEIYKASAPDVEETRTFYINGYMARRATSKYRYYGLEDFALEGSQYKSDGITVQKNNFPTFEHPEDLEMTQRFLWMEQRAPVKDIVDNGDTWAIVMDQPYWNWATTGTSDYGMSAKHSEARAGTVQEATKFFVLENARELLDQPGEFFFDKRERVIYYYPYYEEDLETAETYVGTTEMMLKFNGESKENKLTNLKFENLAFKHGAWNELSTTGKVTDQADKYRNGPNQLSVVSGGGQVPCQIQFNFADGIEIRDCEFSNLGSGAVGMIDGVSNAKFIGNIFRDITGTGIVISTPDHGKYLYERPASEKPHDIQITNNVFRRCSLELTDTTAVAVYFADDISMTHNYIADVPYSGTTMGWGWGTNEGTDIGCYNVDVSYNHVVNNMQVTADGGALYFLANMFNSTVIGNFIDGSIYGNGGIYFDGGSAFLTAKDNVVINTPKWLKKNIWGGSCFAMDNFTNMRETADIPSNHPANLITVTNTTYMTEDISAYPKAVEICENAGLTDEYKHLMEGTDLPEWMPILWNWEPMRHFVGRNTWSDVANYVAFYDPDDVEPYVYEPEMFSYTNTIGVTSKGEWQEYDIEIYEDGEYTLRMIAAQPARSKPGVAKFWCDGEVLAEKEVPVVVAGDYITGEFEVGRVYMTKGVHRIRVEQAVANILPGAFMFDDGKVHTTNDYNYDECIVEPCVPNVQPVAPDEYRDRFAHIKGAAGVEDADVFEDVKGHWAISEIGKLAKLGIIKGVSETRFAPENNVSLYEAIWLALRVADKKYTDDNWKQMAVNYGMLTSVNEADKPISRERFAYILMKMYISEKDKYTLTIDPKAYTDIASISNDYLFEIYGAKQIGIMAGMPDGSFKPKATLTRAEAATAVYRLYTKLID